MARVAEEKVSNVARYNYPSFSGAFAALSAYLYDPRLNLPSSSRLSPPVEDFYVEGLEKCYLLDFVGSIGFARKLSEQLMCEVLAFDHRNSALPQIKSSKDPRVTFNVNVEKGSSITVYEHFSNKLASTMPPDVEADNLLNSEDRNLVETVLTYIQDADLHTWSLPEIKAFRIGVGEWRSKLNCITNTFMYEKIAANWLLDKAFKVRLGRGFFGECLVTGVRADGNSDLSGKIDKLLSLKSATAGLRPIGTVVYMQRKNLKMCLRSTGTAIDTSEVANAYGGGGCPSSSFFIIRTDEYNHWLSGKIY